MPQQRKKSSKSNDRRKAATAAAAAAASAAAAAEDAAAKEAAAEASAVDAAVGSEPGATEDAAAAADTDAAATTAAAEKPQANVDEHPYRQGAHLTVTWGAEKTPRLAEVIERAHRNPDDDDPAMQWNYYVHFLDFNRRMDEWITCDRIVEPPSVANKKAKDHPSAHPHHKPDVEEAGRSRRKKRKLEEEDEEVRGSQPRDWPTQLSWPLVTTTAADAAAAAAAAATFPVSGRRGQADCRGGHGARRARRT